ncbi:S-adenosyl-L-methionine-dependent methyltransferase [Neocallimastix lanati (nom. inval.)]|uniref:S-adenosyl-L-methionine-dependent methyltransferase n=1 Tax=Neocallimastix californiae TaxID=1754190 RepID=A0A1Y1ZVH9_9FUNG|nr:S-adenosyl-L-methionine-dependent methyltransferase [Neocallimastix sp. JGI-2020a]ORY13785.1 S-adenosyl-L-methionine-dependent methyltransferase [Neocallimastix californiae]|eukprot:ORY13785.1 S-adenosyl-L-methionine-dependent methyltransferase [Neocallimastix californiae]
MIYFNLLIIPKFLLFISSVCASIKYKDGRENEVADILKKASNLASTTDIAPEKYDQFLLKYHLSSIRSNAIRHLNFKGLDVLELGAGMGACSRFIAENAAHLTALEGTEERMNSLRERLRDLNNWDGIVSNYQDFKTDKKYDVVCFFGVFEYAGLYIDSVNPFEHALNLAKSFLKEDGVLLITIENKNGLKYFAGLSEDHHPLPYYGICGYPETNDTKTFSKKEMVDMLKKCGLSFTDIHHLAPDYKLTKAVMTDEFVQNRPIVAANIMSNYPFEDYYRKTKEKFQTKLSSVSLAKSGLIGEFSNSYLFISSPIRDSKVKKSLLKFVEDGKVSSFLYTHGRKNNIVTKFIKNNNDYIVHKEWLTTEPKDQDKRSFVKNKFVDTPLYDDLDLKYLFLNYAYYGKKKEYMSLLFKYVKFIFDEYKTNDDSILKKEVFDALPNNAIFKNDQFFLLDEKHEVLFDITKEFFLFHLVLNDFKELKPFLKSFGFKTLKDLYKYLCRKFGIKPKIKRCAKLESSIYKELFGKSWEIKNILADLN